MLSPMFVSKMVLNSSLLLCKAAKKPHLNMYEFYSNKFILTEILSNNKKKLLVSCIHALIVRHVQRNYYYLFKLTF